MGKPQSKYKSIDVHVIEAIMQSDLPRLRNILCKLPHYANKPLDNNLRTALIYAGLANSPTIAKVLVTEFRADVNIPDKDGWTALTHSIYSNRSYSLDFARFMCEAGANIQAKTAANTTALDAAYGCEQLTILLHHYANYGPFARQKWHIKKKLLWVYRYSDGLRGLPLHLAREALEFV
jgi:ankyrin repeat protein